MYYLKQSEWDNYLFLRYTAIQVNVFIQGCIGLRCNLYVAYTVQTISNSRVFDLQQSTVSCKRRD